MFYIWLRLIDKDLQVRFINRLRENDCDFFVNDKEVVIKVKELSMDNDWLTIDTGDVTFGFKPFQIFSLTYL